MFLYTGYKRIYTDYAPTLNCGSLDTYTLKVGLITADEVEFAGGKNADNKQYYLYNGQHYWTMSPYWSQSDGEIVMFAVRGDNSGWYAGGWTSVIAIIKGGIMGTYPVSSSFDIRPVINLRSDITISSGNGTLENPYIVAD